MRQPPLYTSWIITCHSAEETQRVRNWLTGRIQVNRVIVDTVRTVPDGVEQVKEVPHRLGDYFAALEMEPVSATSPSSIRLLFRKLPQAGRYWKDLMVSILEEIKATPGVAAVALDHKGDEESRPPAGPAIMANAASRSESERVRGEEGEWQKGTEGQKEGLKGTGPIHFRSG